MSQEQQVFGWESVIGQNQLTDNLQNALKFDVKRGDHVIVETARGIEYGTVVGDPKEVAVSYTHLGYWISNLRP